MGGGLAAVVGLEMGWEEAGGLEAPVAAARAALAREEEDEGALVVEATRQRHRSRSNRDMHPHGTSRPSPCWRTSCASKREEKSSGARGVRGGRNGTQEEACRGITWGRATLA